MKKTWGASPPPRSEQRGGWPHPFSTLRVGLSHFVFGRKCIRHQMKHVVFNVLNKFPKQILKIISTTQKRKIMETQQVFQPNNCRFEKLHKPVFGMLPGCSSVKSLCKSPRAQACTGPRKTWDKYFDFLCFFGFSSCGSGHGGMGRKAEWCKTGWNRTSEKKYFGKGSPFSYAGSVGLVQTPQAPKAP